MTGFNSESECLERFGLLLLNEMQAGDTKVEFIGSVLTHVTHELLGVFRPDGKFESPEGRFDDLAWPDGFDAALADLRAACYREGAGTWFSARIVVSRSGVNAEYNYDNEPPWNHPVDPVVYVHDFEKFPRDEEHQPEWLKAKLAEGRARLAAQRDR